MIARGLSIENLAELDGNQGERDRSVTAAPSFGQATGKQHVNGEQMDRPPSKPTPYRKSVSTTAIPSTDASVNGTSKSSPSMPNRPPQSAATTVSSSSNSPSMPTRPAAPPATTSAGGSSPVPIKPSRTKKKQGSTPSADESNPSDQFNVSPTAMESQVKPSTAAQAPSSMSASSDGKPRLQRVMSVQPKRPAPPRPSYAPSIQFNKQQIKRKNRIRQLKRMLEELEKTQATMAAKGVDIERRLRDTEVRGVWTENTNS